MEFDAFPKNRTIMTKMKGNRDIKIHNLLDTVDVVEVDFLGIILSIERREFRGILRPSQFCTFQILIVN